MKRKARTKLEFIGWGSRPLIEFLKLNGIDTSSPISQFDVTGIINKYVNDKNLIHPNKKKRVQSDEWLLYLFGKRTFPRIKIYDMLETHFAENQGDSDEDYFLFSSEEEDGVERIKEKRVILKKKKVLDPPKSCFAAIIPANIKLVYLKRSLVQNLYKDFETFEGKILGSFVRIKSDPNDYLQKNSHMLVQVTGLKKASRSDEKTAEVVLQVSNFVKDVSISMLSDDNFSEEECADLCQRIRDGLLRRPTVVELEEKVQVLHQDVTNHWIVGELALLEKLIDRANEKGWRKELFEYLERRQLLQTPDEKSRLLREVPKVIAEEIEVKATPTDFPDSVENGNPGTPKSILNADLNVVVPDVAAPESIFNEDLNDVPDVAVKESPSAWISFRVDPKGSRAETPIEELDDDQINILRLFGALPAGTEEQNNETVRQTETQQRQPTEVQCDNKGKAQPTNAQQQPNTEVIELSDDDDEENENPNVAEVPRYDLESYMWYYRDPQGDEQGPFCINALKRWDDDDYFPPGFKIWMMGQNPREAVLLSDVLRRSFPVK